MPLKNSSFTSFGTVQSIKPTVIRDRDLNVFYRYRTHAEDKADRWAVERLENWTVPVTPDTYHLVRPPGEGPRIVPDKGVRPIALSLNKLLPKVRLSADEPLLSHPIAVNVDRWLQ